MKKIFVLLLFSFSLLLAGDDALDTFLDDQVGIENQLLDANLSDGEKEALEIEQESSYNTFLIYYVSNKEFLLNEPDPNRIEASRLRVRLKANREEGNIYAVMRDEVRLNNLESRSLIRKMIHDILWAAEENGKKKFKKKVFEILDDSLSHFQPLNTSKYKIPKSTDQNNMAVQELQKEITDTRVLDVVMTKLTNRITHHSTIIYNTAKLSNFKLFELAYQFNSTEAGKRVDHFLEPLGINSTQITFILILLILAYIAKKLFRIIFDKILKHSFPDEEDISFIHTKITRVIDLLLLVFVLYLILVITEGIDYNSIWFNTVFPIVFTLLIGLLVYRITSTIAALKIEKLSSVKILRKEVVNLGLKVIYTIIFVAVFMIILKIFGVNLATILGGLGIGGAAVAFAAKDSIANIFGSISVLMGNVFEQGDWIEVGDISGTVVEIGLRATTVRTFDNSLMSIPNNMFANQGIRNWSRRSVGRRIRMSIGVTYGSDFQNIRRASQEIKEMLLSHPDIADDRTKFNKTYRTGKILSVEDHKGIKNTTMVFLDEFADSSINILISCFSRTVVAIEWREVKEDVMYQIAEILEKNNLEFAFPSLTIYQGDSEPD